MKKLEVFTFLVIFILVSCNQKNKKNPFKLSEKLDPKATVIFKQANALNSKFGDDNDSLNKVSKLIDTALKIDSASIFVISKIEILRKQGKREQIMALCDYLIKKNRSWFYPYYLKGNNYEYLKITDLADANYLVAIDIINSQTKISCDDLNYLLLISLVRKNTEDISLYSKEIRNGECRDFVYVMDTSNFNRADFLENN